MHAELVIAGSRVGLRRWRESHADSVFAACQDPEIQRWTGVPVPYEQQHGVEFVTTVAVEQWSEDSGAPMALVERAGGRITGSMSVLAFHAGVASLGYWTAPEMRGRGYTVEGLRLLAGWCFAERDVVRVEAVVEAANQGSRAVADRAGMIEEGTLRQRMVLKGRRIDVVMYSLLRTEDAATDLIR